MASVPPQPIQPAQPASTPSPATDRGEHQWPPIAAVAATIGLQLLLPDRLTPGPHLLVPAIELVLLVGLMIAAPWRLQAPHLWRRRMALAATGLASLANGISLVLLTRLLLDRNVTQAHALVISGAVIWLTNVLIMGLWFWEVDAGGPGSRAAGLAGDPDFLFPQMTMRSLAQPWRPRFPDYFYVALTNATAFSPTDTMPLSVTAKMLMSVQSLISLVTATLVIARAVNIL